MVHDHNALREIYARLLAAMMANAADDTRALWQELDRAVRSHMEAEERFVLPLFAHANHAEALALLRDHGQIRELLFELGIAVDLHLLRYDRAQELSSLLLVHAAREEKLLYLWADEGLGRDVVQAIKERVAAA